MEPDEIASLAVARGLEITGKSGSRVTLKGQALSKAWKLSNCLICEIACFSRGFGFVNIRGLTDTTRSSYSDD
ncbi:hypothetical protein TB2_026611 [Malus domestica]